MSVPNIPIVNLGETYLTGALLTFVTTTTITVTPGQGRDSTNTNDIVLRPTITAANAAVANPLNLMIDANAPNQTLNVRANGANGLDTGVLAANTFYYVFIISSSIFTGDYNSDSYLPAATLISLSRTAPTLPANYDMFRRIGTILTNATAAPNTLLLSFTQTGRGKDREMWYDASINVLAAAAAAAFTAQSLAVAVPPQATTVSIYADLLPNAPADFVELRPTGSTSVAGYAKMSGDVAAVHHFDTIRCPCNATPSIDWITDAASTVALNVRSYVDEL